MSDQPKHIDDGGPAFPIPLAMAMNANIEPVVIDSQDRCASGMSLRDYFAAKAMASIIAVFPPNDAMPKESEVAKWSYDQADAMLAARKESK